MLRDWFLKSILFRLTNMEIRLMAELDDLKAQVAATIEIEKSAVTLINGIADRINAAKGDPAALEQLATDLKGESDALAAAVAANTPAPAP